MELYILRPQRDLPEGDDPWDPWYDKAFGFVVCAKSEKEARQLAHDNHGDENRGEFLGGVIAKTKHPWLDVKYSTCDELKPGKVARVIMRDFASA